MSKFVVGKSYRWGEIGLDPIRVVRRTMKSIWVDNGRRTWLMRIRTDDKGREYVYDSTVPMKHRGGYTCYSMWEV